MRSPSALSGGRFYVRHVSDEGPSLKIGDVKITTQRSSSRLCGNRRSAFAPRMAASIPNSSIIPRRAGARRSDRPAPAAARTEEPHAGQRCRREQAIAAIPALRWTTSSPLERYEQAVKAQGLKHGGIRGPRAQDLTLQQLAEQSVDRHTFPYLERQRCCWRFRRKSGKSGNSGLPSRITSSRSSSKPTQRAYYDANPGSS